MSGFVARRDVHATARERHATWAAEFAIAGDLDSAVDALLDLRALAAELEQAELGVEDV